MDSIVQDLVFGKKRNKSAAAVGPVGGGGVSEVAGNWVKDKSLVPAFLRHGSGGTSVAGGGAGRSRSSTPTTRYDSSSSAHSSVRLRWVS